MITNIFYPELTVATLFISWAVALACGAILAVAYRIKNRNYSKNLIISLILFPLVTQTVVMLVNRVGDTATIGVGVAIAGVFGLVRFRSIQGNSREISCVFIAMAIGVKYKSGKMAIINGWILSTIYIGFLIYLGIFA